ncbi:hypothetical protein K3G64_00550 (plasmid) [Mycobacterium sp. IDR2000157661]|nr:hypothetical protein K3G64_00550 [Mycobacterium sp. IDR2000157661]
MSNLRQQGMPNEDLSDLGAPAKPRGAGLADLVGETAPPAAPTRSHEPTPQPESLAPPTPIRPAAESPDGAITAVRGRRPGRPRTRSKPVTAVYVSPGVKARFEAYRHKQKATNLQVVLEAISAKHAELAEIIKDSTVSTAPVNPLFPADPNAVRYLGGGSVQIGFSPTPEQEEVIDRIGAELGFDTRSTWIAPVLNAFLPGRRDVA